MRIARALAAAVVGLTCALHALAAAPVGLASAPPAEYTEKVPLIPDYPQTAASPDREGNQLCAPSAVSNSLMFLASRGYVRLHPGLPDAFAAQTAMVRLLSSERLMNTNSKNGTGPSEVLRGARGYVEHCGYTCARLEYQGWRPIDDPRCHQGDLPDLEWIKAGIAHPNGAVWLNVGWYSFDPRSQSLVRSGGHWVTLVGYGRDPRMGDMLVIHDPSPRTGNAVAHDLVALERLPGGQLVGAYRGLPRPAAGFYRLGGGLKIKRGAQGAILDAAIVLVLAGR